MIRKLILRYLITFVSIAGVTYIIPGITYSGGILGLLKIVTVFFAANLFLKPILHILALPIEIATLGFFSLAINSVILWLVAVWVPEFKITSFWFSGLRGPAFVVAPIEIPMFLTAAIGALAIGFISTILYWITK